MTSFLYTHSTLHFKAFFASPNDSLQYFSEVRSVNVCETNSLFSYIKLTGLRKNTSFAQHRQFSLLDCKMFYETLPSNTIWSGRIVRRSPSSKDKLPVDNWSAENKSTRNNLFKQSFTVEDIRKINHIFSLISDAHAYCCTVFSLAYDFLCVL